MIRKWLILIWAVFLPLSTAEVCSSTGEWAEWGDWSECPQGSSSVMNFKRRIRGCEARPVGCEQTESYSCPGSYSEVTYCTTTTSTTVAQTTTTTTPVTTTTTRYVEQRETESRAPTGTTGGTSTSLASTAETSTAAVSTATTSSGESTAGTTDMTTDGSTTDSSTVGSTAETSTEGGSTKGTTSYSSTVEVTSPTVESSTAASTAQSTESSSTGGSSTIASTEGTDASTATSAATTSGGTTGTSELSTATSEQETETTAESTTESSSDGTETGSTATETELTMSTTGESSATEETTSPTAGSEASTTSVESTSFAAVVCDNCEPLNIYLFNGEPYEDGAAVLNRYTASGCRYVQFFCRPIETGDTRSVRTVYNMDGTTELSLNLNLACRNGEWLEESADVIVNSLSCVYDLPATSSSTTTSSGTPGTETTPAEITSTTTLIPGIDPNNPCMNCSHLVVSPPNSKEGITYMEHELDECLDVQVFCMPSHESTEVDLMCNGESKGLAGPSVNRTFSCNADSKWMDTATGSIVENVACAMVSQDSTQSTTESTAEQSSTGFTSGSGGTENTEASTGSTSTGASDVTDASSSAGTESTESTAGSTTAGSDATDSTGQSSTSSSDTSTSSTEATEGTDDTTGTTETSSTGGTDDTNTSSSGGTSSSEMTTSSSEGTENTDGTSGSTTAGTGATDSTESSTSSTDNSAGIDSSTESTSTGGTATSNSGATEAGGTSGSTGSTAAASSAGTDATESSDESSTTSSLMSSSSTDRTESTGGKSGSTESSSTAGSGATEGTDGSTSSTNSGGTDSSTVSGSTGGTDETATSSSGGTESTDGTAGSSESSSTSATGATDTSEKAQSTTGETESTMQSAETTSGTIYPEDSTTGASTTDSLETFTAFSKVTFGTTSSTDASSDTASTATPTETGTDSTDITTTSSESTGSTTAQSDGTQSTTSSESLSSETGSSVGSTTPQETTDDETESSQSTTNTESGSTTGTDVTDTTATLSSDTTTDVTSTPNTESNSGSTSSTQSSTFTSESKETTGTSAVDSTVTDSSTSSKTSEASSTSLSTTGTNTEGTSSTDTSTDASTHTPISAQSSSSTSEYRTLSTSPTKVSTENSITTSTTTSNPFTSVTTTGTQPGSCGMCTSMNAEPVNRDDCYNGMMVLDHYTNEAGDCLMLDVDCRPKTESENTTIMFDTGAVGATGAGSHQISLTCSATQQWMYDGSTVNSVSCMVQRAVGMTDMPPASTLTTPVPTPTTTTTAAPGTVPCKACQHLNVVDITEPGFEDGQTTLLNSNFGDCSTVSVTCSGVTDSDEMCIMVDGTEVASGISRISLNLTCDDSSVWTTLDGTVVPQLACGIRRSTPTTPLPTTAPVTSPNRCSECQNLEALPMTVDGYNNGMMVLDHNYDDATCRTVEVECRPDMSYQNAKIVTNGNEEVEVGAGQQMISMTCNSAGTWTYNLITVTSVSCLTEDLSDSTATQPVTVATTPGPSTSPTTLPPGTDPCSACSRISVGSLTSTEYTNGFTTLFNGKIGVCKTVQVSCEGYSSTDEVALVSNGVELIASLDLVSMNFTCGSTSEWISSTGNAVSQIGCGIQTAATSTVSTSTSTPAVTTASTTAPTTSTASTPGRTLPPRQFTMDPGLCNDCLSMTANTISMDGYYNGMMVLDHYTAENSCKMVDVECRPKSESENSTILLDDTSSVATGPGRHIVTFGCSTKAEWEYEDRTTTSVSCAVLEAIGSTVAPPATTPTPPTEAPTTLAPGIDPCSACPRIQVNSLASPGYEDGFTTLFNGYVGNCKVVQLLCEGSEPTDELSLTMTGTELMHGQGELTMNLTCNEMSTWETNEGIAVPDIACGIVQPSPATSAPTTPTTTPTPTTPTTTPPTTPSTSPASQCSACEHMQALEPTLNGENEAIGTLVLEHYFDPSTGCRVVVVRCKANNPFENMTVLLNGDIEIPSAPNQVSLSLTCTAEGIWSRLGEQITSAACKATRSTTDVTPGPTTPHTTPVTTTQPGTAACSTCNRMLVTSVPSGYSSGFLTLDAFTDDSQCLGVSLSCASPSDGQTVALIDSETNVLSSAASRVNMSLSCNQNAEWKTPTDITVSTLSCGVVQAAPATNAATDPTVSSNGATTTLPCSQSVWEEWRDWSQCTATCGSCGTHQRFRACNKANPECLCEGTAFEKVSCNLDVCRYPAESSCCEGFRPQSAGGKFQCMPT